MSIALGAIGFWPHQEQERDEEAGDGEPGDVALNTPAWHEVGHTTGSTVVADIATKDDCLEKHQQD